VNRHQLIVNEFLEAEHPLQPSRLGLMKQGCFRPGETCATKIDSTREKLQLILNTGLARLST